MLLTMILCFVLALIAVVILGCLIYVGWPILLAFGEIAILIFIIIRIIKAIVRRFKR